MFLMAMIRGDNEQMTKEFDGQNTANREKTQIQELEEKLAELKARFPAHSIPPSMMMELDELEEQLAALQAERGQPS
jgi:hypothetical protein